MYLFLNLISLVIMLPLAWWHDNERMRASERRKDCRLRACIPCACSNSVCLQISSTFFRCFPQGNWSYVGLFEQSPATMIEDTYQNIRKLCSGVFSRKQTLPSFDVSELSCFSQEIQVLFAHSFVTLDYWALIRWMQTMSRMFDVVVWVEFCYNTPNLSS